MGGIYCDNEKNYFYNLITSPVNYTALKKKGGTARKTSKKKVKQLVADRLFRYFLIVSSSKRVSYLMDRCCSSINTRVKIRRLKKSVKYGRPKLSIDPLFAIVYYYKLNDKKRQME